VREVDGTAPGAGRTGGGARTKSDGREQEPRRSKSRARARVASERLRNGDVWIIGAKALWPSHCFKFGFVLLCGKSKCNLARVIANGEPSLTALTAAAARAAHLIVDDDPPIFADTLAEAMLGERAVELIAFHRAHGTHPILSSARAQVTCRSRYTEDRLAEAVGRGIGQYVILGAGLDSFAGRSPLADQVRVFEIDHPGTQEWKRRAAQEWGRCTGNGGASTGVASVADAKTGAGSAGTGSTADGDTGAGSTGTGSTGDGGTGAGGVVFVPVDFGRDSLRERLGRAGFDFGAPAFISWLGVTMYLDRDAIEQTLAVADGFAAGTEIVVDYMLPAEWRDAAGNSYAEQVGQALAERGEPWLSLFAPEEMAALLRRHGFGPVRDVRQRDMVPAAAWERTDSLMPADLSRIAHAVRGAGDEGPGAGRGGRGVQ
jgi:O-methyltransferase involved in polyketide biosynthesis